MKQSHSVLIVEDNPETAEDLVDIVSSLDCTSVVVDNRDDALHRLQSQSFCFLLLDLQIKGKGDSIKSDVIHGKAVLREARQRHGDHHGPVFRWPVLVVSGYAREGVEAVDVMKDGASDIIYKPINGQQVSERIRSALEKSGRESHKQCRDASPAGDPKPELGIVIAIPGDRVGRRTRVTVGSASVRLTNEALTVLLHLIVTHRRGVHVNKRDMGGAKDQGFKGVSRLREQLAPALVRDIIDSHYYGEYGFTNEVTIGECAVDKLEAIGDAKISGLARQLRQV